MIDPKFIEEARRFDSSFSSEAYRREFQHVRVSEHLSQFFVKLLKPPFNGRALDIGCGCGAGLDKLSNLGFDVEGVDNHPENVVTPGHVVRAVDLNSEFLPFQDECFDVVICTDVLEHLFYPRFVLKEIARLLKRNTGYAVLSLPNEFHLWVRMYVLFGRQLTTGTLNIGEHHCFPNIGCCRDFVQSVFEIEKEIYNFRPHFCRFYPNIFSRNVFFRVHPKVGITG